MLRMFQFINHGGRIILYRNMAVPHNVHNHVILSQTITSRTYSRSHIRCRREKHPVHFFLFRQELQIKLSLSFYSGQKILGYFTGIH